LAGARGFAAQPARADDSVDIMENRIFSLMFGDLARDFGQPVMLWQAGILLATLAIAWLLARLLRRTLELRRQSRYQTLQFGAESLNRAAFPLIGAALVWLARAITGQFMHTSLLDLALVPLFGIGLIYIVFFFARRSLAGTARSIRGCSSSRRSSRRRSLRIGDTINVSGLQGMVTQIRTRYTVVRGLDGIETLIPNEKLITDVVQNQSSYLTRGYAKVAVQVAYASDVEHAMGLLARAAEGVPRVLREPAPTPYLASFGQDGINLELDFWIEDAATGTSGVRSTVNRNIWRLFLEHGISIPFAQREVRIVGNAADASLVPVTMTAPAASQTESAR
jgi:small-conductance mechanosensitive channel